MTKFAIRAYALTALLMSSGHAAAAGGGGTLHSMQADISNLASLQQGARTYFNYCAGCHSLQYLRYQRLAADLNLPEAQVMQNFNFTGAKFGEPIMKAMPSSTEEPATGGAAWFGKAPPDLSLVARSRGASWLYSYLLAFYPDPNRPLGWNNAQFPAASMPHVLWQLQGVQQPRWADKPEGGTCPPGREIDNRCFDGFEPATGGSQSEEAYRATIRSLVNFLEYAGEPAGLKREQYGVWVLLYLTLLAGLAYLLKREYWKDVH